MNSLSQIEKSINQLSRESQLLLVERIIHSLRKSGLKDQSNLDNQLSAMAADPEIKIESQKIKEEFAITESDGLEIL